MCTPSTLFGGLPDCENLGSHGRKAAAPVAPGSVGQPHLVHGGADLGGAAAGARPRSGAPAGAAQAYNFFPTPGEGSLPLFQAGAFFAQGRGVHTPPEPRGGGSWGTQPAFP